jgi:hypothetical protein
MKTLAVLILLVNALMVFSFSFYLIGLGFILPTVVLLLSFWFYITFMFYMAEHLNFWDN